MSYKDVDVGLAVAAYTVSENDRIVEVCVSIVAGSLGVPVNVLLATTDGTATGEGKIAKFNFVKLFRNTSHKP